MRNRYALITAVALAALSVQGCHKSPTAPALPDVAEGKAAVLSGSTAKGGNGGGNPAPTALVTMQGGMVGAPRPVDIEKDDHRELRVSGAYENEIAMWMTRDACAEGWPADKLVDPTQERFRMVMLVDRSGDDHRLTLNFEEADGSFKGVLNVAGGVSVAESSAGEIQTFLFSGGTATVQDRRGKVRDYVTVTCQNMDPITVILDRSA